jgi:hypothetical protein
MLSKAMAVALLAAEARSPVHHVKLVKGKLHAVVTSHDKLFEWIAERK